MRKSIIFAIAASVIAASCTLIEADETFVNEESAASFYLGAEINVTRTVLGDKDGSTYPVLWQAGDRISVNGVVSDALSEGGTTKASFGFASELTAPFNAIYPASAAVAGNTVEIPAVQTWVEGSYDPAAAIMVGTGSSSVSFNCAVAFLKIKTTGAADAMIARAEVVALGGEWLSGEFTTDYSGIAAKSDGKGSNATAVVCGTPVAAGTEIIVAIPAQTYASGIAVVLQDAEGKAMYKKSTASFSAEAGKMYTTDLAYAPVALEGTITVDGEFADWDSVPAVTYSLAPGTKSPAYLFKKMKITADNKFVYMYVEVDESFPYFGTYVDIFVDNDCNTDTGGKLGSIEGYSGIPYTDSGLEWYIEGGCYDNGNYVDWFQKYHYGGTDGGGIFTGLSNETANITEDQFAVSGFTDGKQTGRFEIKMDREVFGFTGAKAGIGIKNILGNPSLAAGLLPQGVSDGSDFARVPMAAISMKEISTEPVTPVSTEPITIDGSFDDWAALEDCAVCTVPEEATLTDVRVMKAVASEDYLYVYWEIVDEYSATGSRPVDVFIDADGNASTGYIQSDLFSIEGAEWYVETNLYNGPNYHVFNSGAYKYGGADGAGPFTGLTNLTGTYGSESQYANIVNIDGIAYMEARFSREFFELTGPTCAIGIKMMLGIEGWPASGLLPQNGKLMTVILDPDYEPEEPVAEPIDIDGLFDDWADAEGVASYEVPADAKYPNFYTVKAVASPKYVYLFMNAKDYPTTLSRTYLGFDTDADSATGFNLWQGNDNIIKGGEFYIETYLTTDKGVPNTFTALTAAQTWNGADNTTYKVDYCVEHKSDVNANISVGKTVIIDEDVMVEWRLDRKFFGFTGTKARLGIRYYSGWTCVGVCPQKSANEGVFVPDSFEFTLPAFAE